MQSCKSKAAGIFIAAALALNAAAAVFPLGGAAYAAPANEMTFALDLSSNPVDVTHPNGFYSWVRSTRTLTLYNIHINLGDDTASSPIILPEGDVTIVCRGEVELTGGRSAIRSPKSKNGSIKIIGESGRDTDSLTINCGGGMVISTEDGRGAVPVTTIENLDLTANARRWCDSYSFQGLELHDMNMDLTTDVYGLESTGFLEVINCNVEVNNQKNESVNAEFYVGKGDKEYGLLIKDTNMTVKGNSIAVCGWHMSICVDNSTLNLSENKCGIYAQEDCIIRDSTVIGPEGLNAVLYSFEKTAEDNSYGDIIISNSRIEGKVKSVSDIENNDRGNIIIDESSTVTGIITDKYGDMSIHGDVTLTDALTVPNGKTLTIPEGSTLELQAELTIEDGAALTVDGKTTGDYGIINNGTVNGNGNFDNAEIINSGTITGGTFMSGIAVLNNGVIKDGNFKTAVGNYGTITGGVFLYGVLNEQTGAISGGTYYELINDGTVNGGLSEYIINYGTINNGEFYLVVNSGTINGGTFNEPVKNEGGTINCPGHKGGAPTCTAPAKCNLCGEEYGEPAGHTGGTPTCTDLAVCDTCGLEYGELEPHTPAQAVKENEIPATCSAQGSYESAVYCSKCSSELSRETFELEKLPHSFTEWQVNGDLHERSCTVCGMPEDDYHDWGAGVITKQPTTAEEGEMTYSCTVCPAVKTEVLDKLTEERTAAPVISPNGGKFTSSVKITITCPEAGAKIFYTTDGSEPTSASAKYTGELTLTASATVKAIAIIEGKTASDTVSAEFTKTANIPAPTPSRPSAARPTRPSASESTQAPSDSPVINGETPQWSEATETGGEKQLKFTLDADVIHPSINLGAGESGKTASLMKYVDGKPEPVSSAIVNADGSVLLRADGAGDYLIVIGAALRGDADNNGTVNALDAAIILKNTADGKPMTDMKLDMNGDGIVNALDAAAILKQIANA